MAVDGLGSSRSRSSSSSRRSSRSSGDGTRGLEARRAAGQVAVGDVAFGQRELPQLVVEVREPRRHAPLLPRHLQRPLPARPHRLPRAATAARRAAASLRASAAGCGGGGWCGGCLVSARGGGLV
jgi:hypothetical protein